MSLYSKIIDLQKLGTAWQRVKKNRPAAGADSVSCEIFDADSERELKQLNIELAEHRYRTFPVKLVTLEKEGKLREVSLYTMRDKVVQASLAKELAALFEPELPACACAYRNEYSALTALFAVEKEVISGRYRFTLKTDVRHFFDCIVHEKLKNMLRTTIREEDVIDLIFLILKTPSVGNDGELNEKSVGIYQGASISPVLSNIYMKDLDLALNDGSIFYVRYADDMIILAETYKEIEEKLAKLKTLLGDLGLSLNTEKTCVREIRDGFEFLGYAFNDKGRRIPEKAENKLSATLEDTWLTMKGLPMKERLQKSSQILNGWEQYFRGERPVKSIFEYATLIYMVRHKNEARKFSGQRTEFVNSYKDIAIYLAEVWKELGLTDLELLEYEQYFETWTGEAAPIENDLLKKELISSYESLMKCETEEAWSSVIQSYSDAGCYTRSEKAMDCREKLLSRNEDLQEIILKGNDEGLPSYNQATLELMAEIFTGREDMYVRETLTAEKKRKNIFVPEPLTIDVFKEHMAGTETAGTFLVRNNSTVHYMLFDVDISRRFLLSDSDNDVLMASHLKNAAEMAVVLKKEFGGMGLQSYIEFSGNRGYHVWLFFIEWIPVKYVNSLFEIISDRISGKGIPEDVTIENFPAKNRKQNGSQGQTIKLPYGIHLQSGKRSCFCDDKLQPVTDLNDFFSSLARYSAENIKRVIGAHISDPLKRQDPCEKKEIRIAYEKLPGISSTIKTVLEGCSLMRYLVNKSMSTGYLTHFERQSVLYVFGHLGEEGTEFVHTVMSFTLNYQYYITQKFINHLPEKPVSCIKLRDQYKQITAEYGCSCVFKRTKNCYPSPVIHALKQNEEKNHDITIPLSRTLSRENKEKAYEDLNVHASLQSLAEKMVEQKKQKRTIEKAITKTERELSAIFDNAGTDCMEVDMGLLTRRKVQSGYEWSIEIRQFSS